MSYNQSTSDRSDIQYRRTRRSTGYHQQQQQPHRSSPAGYGRGAGTGAVTDSSTNVDPCSSSKRSGSLEKPNNAQGWHQPRVNHSVPDNHNGPNVQSRSQVAGASGGAIPKAPTSQSTTLNTAKAPGDPFSLGPDLMKIHVTVWGPKQDLLNKAADNQLKKEGNSPSSEKTDVQVQHISLPSHMQKSPVTNIRIPSLQTPDQDPQVPHPMHFGGPNMHMQPPNVAPASFQMTLSTGNTLQIQQQVFFQDLPPSHPMHQAQGHGFATPMGAQIHPQLGQQKGPFSSPHTPVQVLHKAERKYQVGAVVEQAKQWKFKGILNKLTPQNFEKLLEQVKSVNIDNAVTLIGVVSQIFDKALMEPTFCEMYADLCFHLSGALPDFKWNGEKISFKRLFLNKCQKEFERGERGEREEEEASRVGRVGEEGQTEQEREEKRLNVRRRMLCNIRLIGELYKKKMLTERIMHACIQKLLGYDQEDPHEENIEALCKLMCTIGVMIDHDKAKVPMDAYFERMKMLSCKQELSSWARFMLVNVIDLRKNKWQESVKLEGPIPDTVGNKDSCVFLKETSTINESMDVNGFNVLPSQVESVRRLFERHPDIAVRFRAKNQLLRNSCMNSLLSLIETLCQPLEDLSNEDLIGAEIALTYVKDSGFSVDWLEKKLDQVKEMKEKEVSGLAILQVTEEKLLKLKQKCAELEALAEEQKAESSATITPLSFYDVV
ncbi:eukaryotic translation initiation factor 4G-like isoform X1 [Brassica napus]|uniref:eukaryotic translation initiation factor 4G isoform X1 n=1 Tax=Brassica napus TaxID=3708 RepID=UPI0020784BD8|nr:eukaryotic translation initiation factor 4G isoform X1 [Brassica napus]XP_048629407.1 eukaryotic translation initiation factor 4G-like isoform X1 [Brassica napus]